MDSSLLMAGSAVAGTAGGGLTVGWIAKILIRNYIKTNEERHNKSEKTLNKVNAALDVINQTMAGMSVSMGQLIELRDRINSDHDEIIKMKVYNKKFHDDLMAQFDKIRNIELTVGKCQDQMSDCARIISSLRKGAEQCPSNPKKS